MPCSQIWNRLVPLGPGLAALLLSSVVAGDEPAAQPRPLPRTRPEVKQLLEEMKDRTPRIPLPAMTSEEAAAIGEDAGYEARLRYHYLPRREREGRSRPGGGAGGRGTPGAGGAGGFGRNTDPKMTLDYRFKTMLFWIVSRTNNCQYCLGHQEIKLAVAGLSEDQIAALDGAWSDFPENEQAAFAFARKLTYEPQNLNDSDIDALRRYYTDLQILEMTLSMAGNNSINRWKEGTGVPQSRTLDGFARRSETPPPADRILPTESFLTPTAPRFVDFVSKVAPVEYDAAGKPTTTTKAHRPAPASGALLEQTLAAAATRKPRLPLVEEPEARAALGEAAPSGRLPNWMRLLANFPADAPNRVRGIVAAQTDADWDLSLTTRAQLSWIIARQDGAWYAVGQARARLKTLGQSDAQIAALDGDWSEFPAADRALFTLARNLAASPVVLTDAEVARALELAGPRKVVQAITYTTHCASFDRITEVAGLPLDP